VDGWLNSLRARVRYGALCPEQQRDLCGVLDEMRLVKDATSRTSCAAPRRSAPGAHIRAMQLSARMLREGKTCANTTWMPSCCMSSACRGSQYPAYGSIVAAGANACVLHYRADAGAVRDGELVLIDAGCELDGYASDITRTFPANGKFTGPQRVLYDLVLASQDAAVAATQPVPVSMTRTMPRESAGAGHARPGPARQKQGGLGGRRDRQRAYFQFYMHRTGHWLGMDVHDCGSYVEPSRSGEVSERKDPSPTASHHQPSQPRAAPGMVLTIEPGIYVRPAEGVPEQFHNIGIRIEDDAIVTATGCELRTGVCRPFAAQHHRCADRPRTRHIVIATRPANVGGHRYHAGPGAKRRHLRRERLPLGAGGGRRWCASVQFQARDHPVGTGHWCQKHDRPVARRQRGHRLEALRQRPVTAAGAHLVSQIELWRLSIKP
jgi:Xaa-Pro aminopeptidase